MPCLFGCLAVAFPRVALFLVWLFGGHYLLHAYHSRLWPLLGFFFLPLTTITFAFAVNSIGNGVTVPPIGWLLTALALLADLGLLGGGHRQWRRYRE
ncbi:MAG TPA: hypothetical protein VHV51_22810 [Polyangiaceae bacterium]|nr:hypothetical protein [Polyangiaceae bacterium]